jgi:hypothetical protein
MIHAKGVVGVVKFGNRVDSMAFKSLEQVCATKA